MTEYTDPTKVKPGSAGTATVRGEANVRVMRMHEDVHPSYRWCSATPSFSAMNNRMWWHADADLRDLLLDAPAGEAPPDSVVITLEEIGRFIVEARRGEPLRDYANYARKCGVAGAARLIDLIQDKLDALPKPVPPEPKAFGAVVSARWGESDYHSHYVRSYSIAHNKPWVTGNHHVGWDELTDVEVLSEGVS